MNTSTHDLSRLGSGERNSATPKARRAERAGARESHLTDFAQLLRRRERTIAVFGAARLVKNTAGRLELLGGSLDDRRAAREWCSYFLHEAIVEVHTHNHQLQAA